MGRSPLHAAGCVKTPGLLDVSHASNCDADTPSPRAGSDGRRPGVTLQDMAGRATGVTLPLCGRGHGVTLPAVDFQPWG